MANTSTTIGRVKDGVDEVVEKAREVVNEGLDSAKKRFDARADELDRRYRKTVAQVRGTAERLTDNVQEHVADARETVADGYTQAKKKVSRLNRNARKYVKDNPGKSLLIATGVGFFLGLGLLGGLVAGHRRETA